MSERTNIAEAATPGRANSAVAHLGTYRRRMPVTLERMYENALDWEHLASLHASSFDAIELLARDADSWRARSTPAGGQANEIELRLDRGARRWITSTLAGRGAGSEVWTYVIVHGPSDLEVVVDFFIPGTSGEKAARLFERYSALYAQLYDEDERMMVQREAALGRQRAQLVEAERAQDRAIGLAVDLGPEQQFAASLPRTVECAARAWRIVALASGPVVFAADCPHWLGPLSDAAVENDSDGAAFVRCPWHGYEFDVRTGACRTGQPCKLPTPPTLQLRDGRWWLEPGAAAAGGI